MLGSIDSNTGDTSLGWDTDQFPMNLRDCAYVMKTVIAQGGLAPGGLKYAIYLETKTSSFSSIYLVLIVKSVVNRPIFKICLLPISVQWIVLL
jgi:xylose isomerase